MDSGAEIIGLLGRIEGIDGVIVGDLGHFGCEASRAFLESLSEMDETTGHVVCEDGRAIGVSGGAQDL